jgi:hypothetical protein
MGRALVAIVVLLLAVAGAAGASPKRAANPSFRVSVTTTYVRHHVIHFVRKPDQTGCHFRTDVDAHQQVVATSREPVTLTFKELRAGAIFPGYLDAKETRRGTEYAGYEPGCPALQQSPPYRGDISGCGTERFTILFDKTRVGYLRGTKNFRVNWARVGADPYTGKCLKDIFVGEDVDVPTGQSIQFPPAIWVKGAARRSYWTTLDPARLLKGKTVVVKWKGAATFSRTNHAGDPGDYEQDLNTNAYSLAFTVTLVPVKPRT